jgi:hypothetical protein
MAALVVLAVRFGAELPPDIVATALQPECILHVPPLPGSLIYLSEAHYRKYVVPVAVAAAVTAHACS